MNKYKVGQRVRIVVEGTLHEDGRGNVLRVIWDNGGGATFSVNGETVHWTGAADITILSEPRPEEPTGLGAVVEASIEDGMGERRPWVLIPKTSSTQRGQEWHGGIGVCVWDQLIDPVVRNEGCTP